jgi:hypothetical protein
LHTNRQHNSPFTIRPGELQIADGAVTLPAKITDGAVKLLNFQFSA